MTEIKNSEDVKDVLCEQIKLLAEKSKECKGADLHFTSSIILDTGKYLNEHYFGFNKVKSP